MSAKIKRKTKASSKKEDKNIITVPHVSDDLLPEWMNIERTKVLTHPEVTMLYNDGDNKKHCVYYWMQRDMRTADNWALLFAQHLAQTQNIPLRVLYVLPPIVPSSASSHNDNQGDNKNLPPKVCEIPMTQRHGTFLLDGLKLIQKDLSEKNVSFHVLTSKSHSDVGKTVFEFTTKASKTAKEGNNVASAVVCDMSPLRQYREWMEDQASPLLKDAKIPLYQVDAHNIVPVWLASPKREVGARTLRPKINKLLPDFLTHFPDFEGNAHLTKPVSSLDSKISWDDCKEYLKLDDSVASVSWAKAGKEAAMTRFTEFCNSKAEGLRNFDTSRNDPNYQRVCSNLSPWVNYGHVSFQRLALEVRALKKYPNGTASYIEEGIVRRELSDNFVYYSRENYDDLSCAAGWAQESLQLHSTDEREYIYSKEELDASKTHDDLWNAAQIQLVTEGHMHGFLRMYWAKKILEWTESPEIALRTGLYFNDRYALDGNDPNGFTGVGWSMMGIHDMGWKERPIFGKIRFMNYAGCKRKFKVDQFVARYRNAKINALKSELRKGESVTKAESSSSKRKASSVTKIRKISSKKGKAT